MPDVDLSGLPGIGDIPDPLRVLMAVGLAGILIILRFDAERFNAAEYNDVDKWGNKPSLLAAPRVVHARDRRHPRDPVDPPEPDQRPLPRPRRPAERRHAGPRLRRDRDRDRDRHRPLPLPHGAAATGGAVPGQRSSTRSRRRSSTRRCSGACCSASCSTAGLQPNLANLIQALVYALATRLGAPGRPWYMLVTAARDRPRRRLAGRDHGRHRGRIPRPLDHAGRDLPHDRPLRPAEGQGHRERGGRTAAGDAQGLARARLRRGVPRPVARRPSPRTGVSSSRGRRSRSTSTCRSASRCARTATSSSMRGPRRADRGHASRPSSARC